MSAPNAVFDRRSCPLRHLYLNVSQLCNLACRYCWVRDSLSPEKPWHMDLDTGEAAVDLLLRDALPRDAVYVSFFGGEPLLNWSLIEHVVTYGAERAAERDNRLRFSLTTNGTLLDPDRAAFLARAGVRVVLSLDGPQAIHDRQRPFPTGEGSYEQVRQAADMLRAAGVYTVAEAILTRENLSVPDVLAQAQEMGVPRLHTLLVRDGERWGITPAEFPALLAAYETACADLLSTYRPGSTLPWINLEWAASAVRRGRVGRPPTCRAGRTSLGVATDGGLYPCFRFVREPETALGDVWRGIDGRAQEAFVRATAPNPPCLGCTAWDACGGPCFYRAWEAGHRDGGLDPVECQLTRFLTTFVEEREEWTCPSL